MMEALVCISIMMFLGLLIVMVDQIMRRVVGNDYHSKF